MPSPACSMLCVPSHCCSPRSLQLTLLSQNHAAPCCSPCVWFCPAPSLLHRPPSAACWLVCTALRCKAAVCLWSSREAVRLHRWVSCVERTVTTAVGHKALWLGGGMCWKQAEQRLSRQPEIVAGAEGGNLHFMPPLPPLLPCCASAACVPWRLAACKRPEQHRPPTTSDV